jgi:sensor domain CHASE-containing protein
MFHQHSIRCRQSRGVAALRALRSEDNDGKGSCCLARPQLLEDFQALDIRHQQVKKNEIRKHLTSQPQAVVAAAGSRDFVGSGGKKLTQRVTLDLIVIA